MHIDYLDVKLCLCVEMPSDGNVTEKDWTSKCNQNLTKERALVETTWLPCVGTSVTRQGHHF